MVRPCYVVYVVCGLLMKVNVKFSTLRVGGAVARRLLGWLLFFPYSLIFHHNSFAQTLIRSVRALRVVRTMANSIHKRNNDYSYVGGGSGWALSQYSTSTILNSSLIHWRFVCLNFIRIRFQCLLCTFQSSRLSISISSVALIFLLFFFSSLNYF